MTLSVDIGKKKMEQEKSGAPSDGEFSMVNRYAIGRYSVTGFECNCTSMSLRAVPQRSSRELKVEDALLYLDQVSCVSISYHYLNI